MYDYEIAVPSDTTNPIILTRLEDFKKYGLLNTENLKIHITFLATKNCKGRTDFLRHGWPSNIDVDVIHTPYLHVAQRIYSYYSTYVQKDFAKWYMRIDEDSLTDMSGLNANLESGYDYNRDYHMGGKINYEPYQIDQKILSKMGYGHWYKTTKNYYLHESPAHEQEISITSLSAMNKVLENKDCKKYFMLRQEFPEGYGDHGLSLACKMCKVYFHEAKFLSCEPLITYFSYFYGHLNHIHWCSRDKNPICLEWMDLFSYQAAPEVKDKMFLFGNFQQKDLVEFDKNHTIKTLSKTDIEPSIPTIGLWCKKDNKIVILLESENELIWFDKDNFEYKDFTLKEV